MVLLLHLGILAVYVTTLIELGGLICERFSIGFALLKIFGVHHLRVRISMYILYLPYVAIRGHSLAHLNTASTAEIFTLLLLCLLINLDELKMIKYEIAGFVRLLNVGKVACSTIIFWARLNELCRFTMNLTLRTAHDVRVFVWLLEIFPLSEAISLLTALKELVLEISI